MINNHALMIALLGSMLTYLTLACTGTNYFVADATCSNNGYCIDNFCSCAPGFSDGTCSTNDFIANCVPLSVAPDSSNFAVSLDASITAGVLNLDIQLPVENSTSSNRATFTSIEFSSDNTCDYPASVSWSRSTDGACLETFVFDDSFVDSMSCFDENCYDALDASVSCLDSSACENTPCRKEYTTVLTVSRGYVKESGRAGSEGIDSSLHGITVIFPWVMEEEATSIEVVSIPDVASNFVVESVTFSGGNWVFTIQTSVLYPWRLSDGGAFDFSTDNAVIVDSVGITDNSCAVDAAECLQTITVTVAGCSTLQDATIFTSSDLKYTCNAVECPNPDTHDASFGFTFDGTDSCDTIQLDVTVDLTMSSFDLDLTTSRRSFIFGSNSQPINFKVSVQTESGDTVTGITLLDIISDAALPGPYTVADLSANPNCLSTEACFSVDANDVGGTSDDAVAIQDITFTATVELTFSQGAKRSMNLKLYTVESSATLILSVEDDTESSFATQLSSMLLFCLFVFLN